MNENPTFQNIDEAIQVVLKSVQSPNTKRAYSRALVDFRNWYTQQGQELSKALVQKYASELLNNGMDAANINQRLTAIRKLVEESADNGGIDPVIAAGILRVKGLKREGKRLGNWLTMQQAQELLDAPDTSTLKGKRDRALLAVLLGCGLRREEAAALTFEHIQQRDGRWVIVDLVGKRNKIRSIPMAAWTKAAIDRYSEAAGIKTGIIFRRIRRGDHLAGEKMTAQAIYYTVIEYARPLKYNLAPHDCRRTFAKLARAGGAPIEQIQYSLGHDSIRTTEIYLGVFQNLLDAPCDHLGIGV